MGLHIKCSLFLTRCNETSIFWTGVRGGKIKTEESILEQVRQFNYLGCEQSLDGETDFNKK